MSREPPPLTASKKTCMRFYVTLGPSEQATASRWLYLKGTECCVLHQANRRSGAEGSETSAKRSNWSARQIQHPVTKTGPMESFTMPVCWMQSSSALLVQYGNGTKDRAVGPRTDSVSPIVRRASWSLTGQLAYLPPVRLLSFDVIHARDHPACEVRHGIKLIVSRPITCIWWDFYY
jgi:hypothetical protein